MREGLESHGGSHDSLIQGILSCYSEMKVKVFGIKYNKSQMGDPLFLILFFKNLIYKCPSFTEKMRYVAAHMVHTGLSTKL